VLIEVDDLLLAGQGPLWESFLGKLKSKFEFGKLVTGATDFNGRWIEQTPDGGFTVDNVSYIRTHLRGFDLKGVKRGDYSRLLNLEEIAMMRSMLGKVMWLGQVGRPDACGTSSFLSSRMVSPNVGISLPCTSAFPALSAHKMSRSGSIRFLFGI
jgi:hypothetical protein